MADLFDRLFPTGEGADKIGVHIFRSTMGDYAAGYTTEFQIITAFNLDTEAQSDLSVLCNAIDGMTVTQKISFLIQLHDVMMIAEAKYKYNTKAEFRTRLGL